MAYLDEAGLARFWNGIKPLISSGGTPLSDVLKAVYPVGALYISTRSANPNTVFGFGTWEAYGQGKTLVGVNPSDTEYNSSGKTGGAKSNTLVADNIPELPVYVKRVNKTNTGEYGVGAGSLYQTSYENGKVGSANPTAVDTRDPYITVYMWRRTA